VYSQRLTAQSVSAEKQVWELTGVPGRSAILLRVGKTKKDMDGYVFAGMGPR
jgi:hypothetical protein